MTAPKRGRWSPLLFTALLLLPTLAAGAQSGDESPLATLKATLAEATAQLAKEADPTYFAAYSLVEQRELTIQGTHGARGGTIPQHSRVLDIDLRVGTMELDSTHKLRDAGFFSDSPRPSFLAPLTNSPAALRRLALRGTDEVYRQARARLVKVRSNDAVKVAREDSSADFSDAPVVTYSAPVEPPAVDVEAWEALTERVSATYLRHPDIHDSAVQLVVETQSRWLVTNAGTEVSDGRAHLRVATWAQTVAEDGMALSVYDYVDVASVDHLPDAARLEAMAQGVAERLLALRRAPLIDPWTGPAILRGRAAGVFFHEIFGHRIEGHRQKDEDEGQTFTQRVGQPILPPFLSVVDDPTVARLAGEDLNGHYMVDDEGVRAQRVNLVDKGILRNFLLSRSPIEGFSQSNGHGRRQPGNAVVPRQGNLMVLADATVSYPELRKQLLAEVKKQKRDWGLVFDDISGGFTFTGRSTPNAFVVQPVTVWRVFADGRPDELVRGVDLIGTPLTTFSRILAAGGDTEVFNGVCGAESGWVPVSASSPSLLVSEVEVQRREKGNDRPPLLPAPGGAQ